LTVLECECGGPVQAVEVNSGHSDNGEGWAVEKYQCQQCGATSEFSISYGPWGQSESKEGCIA
jgi:hypothetical protein